jgi:hypothetical protein
MENKQTLDWKQILEQFKTSGKSARKFAIDQGVSYHALNYNIRKERAQGKKKTASTQRMIPLPIPSIKAMPSSSEVTISMEAGSVTIRISLGS